jgi:hypothetical protein
MMYNPVGHSESRCVLNIPWGRSVELWSGAVSMQSLVQVFVAEGYFFLQSVVFILKCATSDSCCV